MDATLYIPQVASPEQAAAGEAHSGTPTGSRVGIGGSAAADSSAAPLLALFMNPVAWLLVVLLAWAGIVQIGLRVGPARAQLGKD